MEKSKSRKGFKVIKTILVVLLVLIVLIVGFIGFNSIRNAKSMNKLIDESLAEISKHYNVEPVSAEGYDEIRIYGIMNFHVKHYNIEDVGNLLVMNVNAGFMQMASIIITPKEKNLPMLSSDYMYILGNRKSYLEYYNLVENAEDEKYTSMMDGFADVLKNYSQYEEDERGEYWSDSLVTVGAYKLSKPSDDDTLKQMMLDSLNAYLSASKNLPQLDEDARNGKIAVTKEYTENLIKNGGISTDAFKEHLGEDKTRDFFDKVMFGTAE